MRLGSPFDGSGGFPLAGTFCGIEPVWASEIEPYPLKVTAKRFPQMQQLGDVTKIDGAAIPKVDIITFGSPCQDLSVAGAQKGIHEGERSSLFFEAVRIIKEMRASDGSASGADVHRRPRFAVWENVPGAFSSNKGEDFRAVLQALCEVVDPDAAVPQPEKGKWSKAGCIVGDGYSVAWRVYDAQYWGVPQRRKRIYLIADFASERAGEILFESEGVCGDSEESREAREGTAEDASGSARGNCGAFHLQQDPISGDVSPCIGGQHQATVGVFMGGQGAKAGGIGYSEEVSPTLKSVLSGGNTVPDVVTCIEGDGNTRAQVCINSSPTLKTVHTNSVVYPQTTGALCANSHPGSYTGQDAFSDMLPVVPGQPPRKYIVRRLTPLECCRLQGFPDWWEDGVEGSDSARYKMWGNGIALPCAVDVLGRIAKEMKKNDHSTCTEDEGRK